MVRAVQHVQKMRGGAQSHLMRCDDQNFYVVKFQNNPQHRRVLANELLATRLAERVGLPVPKTDVVEVNDWLVRNSPELAMQFSGKTEQCSSGLNFGARYVLDPFMGQVMDYLPESALDRVRNAESFAGILCLDKWTCNANGRQAVFSRKARERKYTATFIDQGYCFNAGEWNFPDSPLRGVYSRNEVYKDVQGWESFEPWLSRVELMPLETLVECADGVPTEWYGDPDDLERLILQLDKRRSLVRELILAFKKSSREPFPRWTSTSVAVRTN